MNVHALRQSGYQLLQDGLQELSVVEENGIRIDEHHLQETKRKLSARIDDLQTELKSSKEWQRWRKRFGQKSNIGSRDQLATIVFEELGFEAASQTASGRFATDVEALQQIDNDFVQAWAKSAKYEKALNTFLRGIERETVNGRLHPFFNLHTVRSFRGSSDSPNFQNFPVRDKEIAEIIRRNFIASKGCVLVENDFKGIEVSMSACYHKDPAFIDYITTPGKDMHRDMAAQIYMLEPAEVSKDARYGAKNKFVFPQFYGDYYLSCARALWEWIEKGKLQTADGVPLRKHLRTCGIKGRGTCDPEQDPKKGSFEHHVREVENDFWNNRFRRYGKWRRNWFASYQERGFFDLKTGFRVSGHMQRNAVTNYPIQGSAFHCLLWTLIQVNRKLRRYKMRSKIVGQIHDSLIGDIRIKELRDYLEIVEETVSVELRKHWPWIIVPMVIEYEIAPIGTSWFDKKEIEFSQGWFTHPTKKDKRTNNAATFLKALAA